jgi:molybdopterin converting factor small subunit
MTELPTVTLFVPRGLRDYCEGQKEISISAADVRSAFKEVERSYPELYRGICDETATVRRHLNVFVNTLHVRDLKGLDTALETGDEIIVLPAVSGG